MTADGSKKGRILRFNSLHRKGLLSLSLLLLTLSTAFGTLNYWYLKVQSQSQHAAAQAALQAEFKGLIDHSVNRLQRLGVVLASLGKLTGRIDQDGETTNSDVLKQQFASVRYELDVDHVMVFDPEGNIKWEWSPDASEQASSEQLIDTLNRVRETEQPSVVLSCDPHCSLNVFMPLLAEGRSVGFISLSQRIADLVLEFSTATSADVAILVPPVTDSTDKILPRWSLQTAALTHGQMLKPVIEHLSERYATPIDIPSDLWLSWKGKDYSLHGLPLNRIMAGASGYILFISDVSAITTALQQYKQDGLLLMGGALIFAELFLFLLLRHPLLRLKHLADTLPLVAQGGYHEAYRQLNHPNRLDRTRDEIDILYETSIKLAQQIEESQLALASERDFIQGLLDSAQVMILTQTSSGKIHTVNNFMSQLLGRSLHSLQGIAFIDLIEQDPGREQFEKYRENLFSSSIHRLEHEATVVGVDGAKRHILWVHTHLGHGHKDDVTVLSVGMDATDRIQAETRSRWLAHHDPLTGLANRLRFQEELERSFAEANRSGIPTALLLLDLDYFKEVNDSSGHAAGDALLVYLADELQSRSRKSDLIARLGGDEFAVLMPATGQVGAESFAQSLNERLSERQFRFGDREYRISASIGIALMPWHGENVEALMANVDTAMYQAKKAGRGRWRFFSKGQSMSLYPEATEDLVKMR
jgi:diguanylate cyclase (GGDEF)-like protein/PAS domain S-box-containing protein